MSTLMLTVSATVLRLVLRELPFDWGVLEWSARQLSITIHVKHDCRDGAARMLEDLIYEWSDFVLLGLGMGVVCPGVFLYVASSIYRERRAKLTERDLWGIGSLLLLAAGAPIVALLLYFKAMSASMMLVVGFFGAIEIALVVSMIKVF